MENLEKYSETPQQLFEKAQQAVADNNRYQAATLFLDAAVKGHCEAQYRVGDCYYNGFGFTKNYEEAVKWYLAAATQRRGRKRRKSSRMAEKIGRTRLRRRAGYARLVL